MNEYEFKNLKIGDTVISKLTKQPFIVIGNFGSRITAVQLADLTNRHEWILYKQGEENE